MTFYDALDVARAAMPLDVAAFADVRTLGHLTACANTTAEPDVRDGQRMQFTRESLEHVTGAATHVRPARRDLLQVIAPWRGCFGRAIKACDARLRELEGRSVPVVAGMTAAMRRGRASRDRARC